MKFADESDVTDLQPRSEGRDSPRPPLLVIAGPTASGKTSVALRLAEELNGELVGADSMQVYKHLNIGTDTPDPDDLSGVVHHLINIIEPDQPYDAAAFARDADRVIEDIHARGKRPILVGGTGLYIRVLLRGLQGAPPPDPAVRGDLMAQAEEHGWPDLHLRLTTLDPETAKRLHPNDGVRILRALEVCIQTGKTMSQWQREHGFKQDRYTHLMLGITRDRNELNIRIDSRVDEMMKSGFLDEVRGLINMGFGPELKPMQALGYRRLCEHLTGTVSIGEAVERTKTDTRRFAKRQRNWFRAERNLVPVSSTSDEALEKAAAFFENREGNQQ